MALQRNSTLPEPASPDRTQHQQVRVEGMAKDQSWPGTFMVLGIFTVVVSFWWVSARTLITYTELGRWFALFAFAGNLLPFRASGLRLGMERLEWFLFNLLAVGPFVFSILLWLNVSVHGPERFHLVATNSPHLDVRRYWIAYDVLPPNQPVTTIPEPLPYGVRVLGLADGCLGYPVITRWEGGMERSGELLGH